MVDNLVADYRHLVVDECHHLSAVSFEVVARRARARYVLGLSATIMRKEHTGELAGKLVRFARNVLLLRGGMEERAPRDHAAPGRHTRRRGADTGRDCPLYRRGIRRCPLSTRCSRGAVSWRGTLAQPRRPPGHRLQSRKTREVLVYGYIDDAVPALRRMGGRRVKGYESLGYTVEWPGVPSGT